jgi:hypothetical protein
VNPGGPEGIAYTPEIRSLLPSSRRKGRAIASIISGSSMLPMTTLNQAIRSDTQLRFDDRKSVETYIRHASLAGRRTAPMCARTCEIKEGYEYW